MNSSLPFGNGAPYMYDYVNLATSSVSPSTIHTRNTALFHYFQRYFLQKAMSVFRWEMPEYWNDNYFLYCLYCWGSIAVLETDKFGVIPQAGGLGGYNVMYSPQYVVISNPLIRIEKPLDIDVMCTLFHLQPDYGGIMDMINYYADLCSLCYESITMNIVNSKLAYMFGVKNKSAAESMKRLFDEMQEGNPAVWYHNSLKNEDGSPIWETFSNSLKGNYIAGDMLADLKKIEYQFDTDLGIPNANQEKKRKTCY